MIVLNCFPAEDRSIWWNVASLIISPIPYTTRTHRFTSNVLHLFISSSDI